jgi:hypothetical protein
VKKKMMGGDKVEKGETPLCFFRLLLLLLLLLLLFTHGGRVDAGWCGLIDPFRMALFYFSSERRSGSRFLGFQLPYMFLVSFVLVTCPVFVPVLPIGA